MQIAPEKTEDVSLVREQMITPISLRDGNIEATSNESIRYLSVHMNRNMKNGVASNAETPQKLKESC